MLARYPLAQFAVLYAVGIVVGNLGPLDRGSFPTRVAEGMTVIALVSTLVLSVILLRERRASLAWCSLAAAILLLGVEIYTLTTDSLDSSIGVGALLLLGWALGIAGAFTRRVPIHPSMRHDRVRARR